MSKEFSAMGISLCRTLGNNVTEETVISAANAMLANGMYDAGYRYIIIGDSWAEKCRVNGTLVPNEAKFPQGLKPIADYLHERGLKLGIVTSAGAMTQNGAPGCFDHEYQDAELFEAWGVDYISHDTVYLPQKAEVLTLIRRMGMALRAAGNNIMYSVFCDCDGMYQRIRATGANAFCTRLYAAANSVQLPDEVLAGYSGSYCFNNCGEITVNDSTELGSLRFQLTVASMMSALMIVDCDVEKLSEAQLAVLTNKAILDIDCDPEARPARRMGDGVYCKFLDNNKYAVAFVNACEEKQIRVFYASDFGLSWNAGYCCKAEPLFGGDAVCFDSCLSCELDAGDAQVYIMTLHDEN